MKNLIKQLGEWQLYLGDENEIEARVALHEIIQAFNLQASPAHASVRQHGIASLDIQLVNRKGELNGGLSGGIYWGWLEIYDLWVSEEYRGRGLGSELLVCAEAQARQRGCQRAWLQTYSFQARGFYEKQGYCVVGQLDDYPPGESLFWMRKDFG